MHVMRSWLVAIGLCLSNVCSGQTVGKIKPFEVTVINSDYSMAYATRTIITRKELKIIFSGQLQGEQPRVLFEKKLDPSEALRLISLVEIDSLKSNYTNPCVFDGLQLTIVFKKRQKKKAVHISNYYQADVAKVLTLMNSLVPSEYQIAYNEQRLVDQYNKCNIKR
jgi:hypothetical protein